MNKKVIELLAGTLKLNVEELTQAITTEDEVDFKLPEGIKVVTSEELETLKDNHGKNRYDAGKTAGSEMLLKDLSEKAGFETPLKDMDSFINGFKDSILKDAKVEPNKKLEEYQNTIENLRNKIGDKEKAFEDLRNDFSKKEKMLSIQSAMPEIPESLKISKQEATNLYMSGREFKEDGVYYNGQKLTDDMERAIDISTDVKNWYNEKGWGEVSLNPTGRGGGSKGKGGTTNTPKTMEEYNEYLESKGIKEGSMEANALLAKVVAENPEI